MKIVVVGTGYVGLVTGACLAEAGHKVSCIDVNKQKIASLKKSRVPFFEPELEAIVKKQQFLGNLNFSTSYKKPMADCEAIFLCVGTPPKKNGNPDLSYLEKSLVSISKSIKNSTTIFIKSTVPVGTNDYAKKFYSKISTKNEIKVVFASNPEFLKEGNAVIDFKNPDRIIIGSKDNSVKQISKKIYSKFSQNGTLIYFCSTESAELIKYASNAFLATKISFINEISRLSDSVGADIHEIQKGMGADIRIGDKFLNAGLGFGGSCFPKDLDGLIMNYKNAGLNAQIAKAAKQVNSDQVDYFIKKICSNVELNNLTIMFWGLAFKPETDDIRESVAIKLIKKLASSAKMIYTYDPIAAKNAKIELSEFQNIKFISSQYQNINKCDILILATEWRQFKDASLDEMSKLKQKIIFDGRNFLDRSSVLSSGIKYIGIGKK